VQRTTIILLSKNIFAYVVDARSNNAFKNRLDKFWKDDMSIITIQVQESRAVARELRDVAAVVFGLKFGSTIATSLRVAKLRKPGFRAPNVPAQNRI